MAKFELAEFKKVHEELNQSLARMQKENSELVEPVLNGLKAEVFSFSIFFYYLMKNDDIFKLDFIINKSNSRSR